MKSNTTINILDDFRNLLNEFASTYHLVVSYHYIKPLLFLTAIFTLVAILAHKYNVWRKGWLTSEIDKRLKEIQRKNQKKIKVRLLSIFQSTPPRSIFRRFIFPATKLTVDYFREELTSIRSKFYLPTFSSVLLTFICLFGLLSAPNWSIYFEKIETLSIWPTYIAAALTKDASEELTSILAGLIVIVVALIIFVAESIRSSKSADEKRVLLKLSRLWTLIVFITIIPFGFLYQPQTNLLLLTAIATALLTLNGFARVIKNLLDPQTSLNEQQKFLRQRVNSRVMHSARLRVGNTILFDQLGTANESGILKFLPESFLPGNRLDYKLFDPPKSGIIGDINLNELRNLEKILLDQQTINQRIATPTDADGVTEGPTPNLNEERQKSAYLLRNIGEEVKTQADRDEDIFSESQAIVAVPKELAPSREITEKIRQQIDIIFKFTTTPPTVEIFRREMTSTKDRMLAAIQAGALGEIDEITNSYIQVAEEFLTTLNRLGGAYTAEQAERETSSIFSGWDEVRWLTDDLRDILRAAANTKNSRILREVIDLPFLIASRAYRAGDHLLFQEFTRFAEFLAYLGLNQNEEDGTQGILLDRAHSFLRNLIIYFIEPHLSGDINAY